MTIHNVALHIPKEIAVGLKSGKYKQFGSIIRNNNGQIVKHLTEIRISDNAVKKLLGNKNVKYGLIGTSVVILAGGSYYGYSLLKINKLSKELIKRLTRYLTTAQKGSMTEDDVDTFLQFLTKNEKALLTLKLDESLNDLFDLVKSYTDQFTEANNYKYHNKQIKKNENKILNLKEYLEVQKDVYCSVIM